MSRRAGARPKSGGREERSDDSKHKQIAESAKETAGYSRAHSTENRQQGADSRGQSVESGGGGWDKRECWRKTKGRYILEGSYIGGWDEVYDTSAGDIYVYRSINTIPVMYIHILYMHRSGGYSGVQQC